MDTDERTDAPSLFDPQGWPVNRVQPLANGRLAPVSGSKA